MTSQANADAALMRLVQSAKLHKVQSHQCVYLPQARPEYVRIAGWSVGLTIHVHDDIEHWHLSTMLWPQGRSSTRRDWEQLGKIVATVADLSGYPKDAPAIEPLTPFETTHPNSVHHWAWHTDGSPLDPRLQMILQQVLGKIEKAKEPFRRARAKVRRNAACPCGSGQKYKKCCGRL